MRLTEHQSKGLLGRWGLPLSKGREVCDPDAATAHAVAVGGPVVLKAQVPFGGRGKAGAIRFAATPDHASREAADLLQMTLRGIPVAALTVEPQVEIVREYYFGITWDTANRVPIALLSAAGGVDVEADRQVCRRYLDPWRPLSPWEGRQMASELRLPGRLARQLGEVAAALSSAFLELDALSVEINPLAVTAAGELIGLDAHVEIDDDAAARLAASTVELGPISKATSGRAVTPLEEEARRIDAMDHRGVAGRVVEFTGDLALLIGGGGASLTVFDAVRRHGGRPANYCEVGGNPTEEKVAALTTLLLRKPGVKRLAVIMNVVNNTRADVMARGVLAGVAGAGGRARDIITVLRVPGSGEAEARELMSAAGVTVLGREVSLDGAAEMAVNHAG
jgi:succinyl-CoA synthetase beta subunit/citryl-CoA synthetase large subunit